MEDQIIQLSKYLSFDVYDMTPDSNDPGKEDISFLVKAAKLIPKRAQDIANIDPGILASYCLAANQQAGELYSKATLWYNMKKISMDAELSRAIVEAGAPATNAEKRAKNDSAYMKAAELEAKGEAYVKFYEGMKRNFEAGHYWAKEKEKTDNSESKMGGYEPHIVKTGGVSRISKNVDEDQQSGDFDFTK